MVVLCLITTIIAFVFPSAVGDFEKVHEQFDMEAGLAEHDVHAIFTRADKIWKAVKMEIHSSTPVNYSVSICGVYNFVSVAPIKDESIIFESKWVSLHWMYNSTHYCTPSEKKYRLTITASARAEGFISFTIVNPTTPDNSRSASKSFDIKQLPATSQRYSSDFIVTRLLTNYKLHTNLTSSVQIDFVKCNLKVAQGVANNVSLPGAPSIESIELKDDWVDIVDLLRGIRCELDSSEYFDTLVTTSVHEAFGTLRYEGSVIYLMLITALLLLFLCPIIYVSTVSKKNEPQMVTVEYIVGGGGEESLSPVDFLFREPIPRGEPERMFTTVRH